METTTNLRQPVFYPVAKIHEAPWNMNVMEQKERDALEADMKAEGPTGHVDALLCAHYTIVDPKSPADELIVVNGNHRLKTAKKLGWEQIKVEVDPSIKDEKMARNITYKKNAERGHIDPVKEAQNYKHLKDKYHLTSKEIAEQYGVDRSTVDHRLSILDVVPEVLKDVAADRKIGASALEVIGTVPAPVQHMVVKKVRENNRWNDRVSNALEPYSLHQVEYAAKEVKQEYEREKKLNNALETSKFKTCPEVVDKVKHDVDISKGLCGGKPTPREGYGINLPWVQCEKIYDHVWNLQSGKTQSQIREERRAKEREQRKEETPEPIPHAIKTTHTVDDFALACTAFIKKSILECDRITGLYDGIVLQFGKRSHTIGYSFNEDERSMHLNYEWEVNDKGGLDELWFQAKEKTWKSSEYKDYHTEVELGDCSDKKEFEGRAKAVLKFLEKWLPQRKKKAGEKETPPSSGRVEKLREEILDALVKLEEAGMPEPSGYVS